jgi:hypothetical protein
VKLAHLEHLPEMVEKFEQEGGHKMGNRKAHKDKSIHQHNIDEDINL